MGYPFLVVPTNAIVIANTQCEPILINKLYIKSNCIELMRGSQLGLAKHSNCNQILDHVADQDYIEFID